METTARRFIPVRPRLAVAPAVMGIAPDAAPDVDRMRSPAPSALSSALPHPGLGTPSGAVPSPLRGTVVGVATVAGPSVLPAAPPGPVSRRRLPELAELAALAESPEVTDVLVNGSDGVWVDRGSGLRLVPHLRLDEMRVRQLAVRLIAQGGRHVDEAAPCADVRLRDGVRVHVVLPPVSVTGTLISIRLPRITPPTLAELVGHGMLEMDEAEELRAIVAARTNLLITGAAGTGKTTLLAALLAEAPAEERIIVIEDVAELRIAHPHCLRLEARQANLEGAGGIEVSRLVREALRMRPDRLVLGECRGAELRDLLAALNTGHDGGAGTLHANSLADVAARLDALGALAGLDPVALARQAISAFGAVVHLERVAGVRRIAGRGRFALDADGLLRTVPG